MRVGDRKREIENIYSSIAHTLLSSAFIQPRQQNQQDDVITEVPPIIGNIRKPYVGQALLLLILLLAELCLYFPVINASFLAAMLRGPPVDRCREWIPYCFLDWPCHDAVTLLLNAAIRH